MRDRPKRVDFPDGWAAAGTWVGADVELDPAKVEFWVAEVVEDVVNNGWPNEDIWPRCDHHADHPLQVGMIRGAAAWYCSRDQSISHRIGALPASFAS